MFLTLIVVTIISVSVIYYVFPIPRVLSNRFRRSADDSFTMDFSFLNEQFKKMKVANPFQNMYNKLFREFKIFH